MWFRRDLRVRDNPALLAALDEGSTTALFVVDPAIWATAGPARRAWLAANVLALADRIPLTIRHGDPREVVPQVADGRRVHVAAETTPYGRRRDDGRGRAGRARRDRVAVRRGAGAGPQRQRRALPGVQRLRPRLARARLVRARPHAPLPRPRAGRLRPGCTGPAGGGGGRGAVRAARRRRGRRLAPLAVLPRRAACGTTGTSATAPTTTAPRGSRPTSTSGCSTRARSSRGPPHVDVRHRAGVARLLRRRAVARAVARRGRTSSPRWRG